MRIQNRSLFKPRVKLMPNKIQNKTVADESTVYIYDEIGYWGIRAEDFVKDFNAITAKTIHIRLNTPGGEVFDGITIANAIRSHTSKTVAHIDGLAASISSVIALAADEVVMSDNAFMMIHNPWSYVIGDAEDMRAEADLLDKICGTIMQANINKTGKDEKEMKGLMDAETWMTAEEALEMGFIDRIDEGEKNEKAKATMFDLSIFANVPAQLKGEQQPPTARELEKILKNSGFSNKQAKEILASGFKDDLRDEDTSIEPPQKVQDTQRDAEIVAQRDVEMPEKKTKDRTADILTRAEVLAPTQHSN